MRPLPSPAVRGTIGEPTLLPSPNVGEGPGVRPASPHSPILNSDEFRPLGRCLSPTPANVYPLTGIGSCKSLLEHRAPPGRDAHESNIVSTNDGGTATQPRAPGHERPHAALCAARHGRLSAASTAPGADIPLASLAGAPGQYCQSAAPRAPGHGRPLATTVGVLCHDRLSAALIATVTLPAGQHRLRQEGLPRTPANPRTLIYLRSHQDTTHIRTKSTDALPSLRIAGGLQWNRPFLPSPNVGEGPGVRTSTPSPGACSGGGLGRGRQESHQVHPAIQVPPYPRSCSTACTGFSRRHHPRAPPAPAIPLSCREGEWRVGPPYSPSPNVGEGAGG